MTIDAHNHGQERAVRFFEEGGYPPSANGRRSVPPLPLPLFLHGGSIGGRAGVVDVPTHTGDVSSQGGASFKGDVSSDAPRSRSAGGGRGDDGRSERGGESAGVSLGSGTGSLGGGAGSPRYPEPPPGRFYMQTLIIYKLGFNQNCHTFTLILLI